MMELSGIIIFVTTIILLYFVYHCLFMRNKYWKVNGIPCVGGALPIIGHSWLLIRMRKNFIWLFYKFYQEMGNRSMIGYYNFCTPGIIVRDPELVKKVLLTEFDSFNRNAVLLDPHLDPLLTSNPFFATGMKWERNRSILQHALSKDILQVVAWQLWDVCIELSNFIKGKIIIGDGNYCVNVQELTSHFAAKVVARVAFGVNGKSSTDEKTFEKKVAQMFQPEYVDKFNRIHFCPFVGKRLKQRFMPPALDKYFRYIIKNTLKNRRKNLKPPDDFLQQIIEQCENIFIPTEDDENEETIENTHSDEMYEMDLTSHAASFFLHGYITSVIIMNFVAFQIAVHPTVQNKLREEVMDILKKYEGEMSYESLLDMKYMEQVIHESLRLFPTLPYLRKICTKEVKLVGNDGLECNVQPGTEVVICTMGLHRDPLFWENPDVFDPKRFEDDEKSDRHEYIYLPFGSGRRICVGMKVAMMQMKALFATLLENYSIEVDSNTKKPIELHRLSALFTVPNNELLLRIKPL